MILIVGGNKSGSVKSTKATNIAVGPALRGKESAWLTQTYRAHPHAGTLSAKRKTFFRLLRW